MGGNNPRCALTVHLWRFPVVTECTHLEARHDAARNVLFQSWILVRQIRISGIHYTYNILFVNNYICTYHMQIIYSYSQLLLYCKWNSINIVIIITYCCVISFRTTVITPKKIREKNHLYNYKKRIDVQLFIYCIVSGSQL